MATVEQVYELIDRTCDIINRLFDMVGLNDDSEPAVRFELGKFMMYLSASDGTISVEEAEVISKISHLDVTPTNIGECIREHNIYSTEFEQTVPTVFNILINVDNGLIKKGIDISGSDILLSAYKAVGELAIKADGEVNENEKNDYSIFIGMLERYRNENYDGAKNLTSGFTKNKGNSVEAPFKNGVAAPKKG